MFGIVAFLLEGGWGERGGRGKLTEMKERPLFFSFFIFIFLGILQTASYSEHCVCMGWERGGGVIRGVGEGEAELPQLLVLRCIGLNAPLPVRPRDRFDMLAVRIAVGSREGVAVRVDRENMVRTHNFFRGRIIYFSCFGEGMDIS